jgi:hypothetical protein
MSEVDPKLELIAQRIVDLKKFQASTSVVTNRSQTALIKDLDPIELSIVAHLVNKALEVR